MQCTSSLGHCGPEKPCCQEAANHSRLLIIFLHNLLLLTTDNFSKDRVKSILLAIFLPDTKHLIGDDLTYSVHLLFNTTAYLWKIEPFFRGILLNALALSGKNFLWTYKCAHTHKLLLFFCNYLKPVTVISPSLWRQYMLYWNYYLTDPLLSCRNIDLLRFTQMDKLDLCLVACNSTKREFTINW